MYDLQSQQGHLRHVQFFTAFLKLAKDVCDLISSSKSDNNCGAQEICGLKSIFDFCLFLCHQFLKIFQVVVVWP